MYEPNPANGNRYLYHWLSPERLAVAVGRGALKPYWKHWIHDLGRFERGISTSFSPVTWMPLEGEADGEPCIVIDRTAFEHRAIEIDSGETYHLTRKVSAAIKAGLDVRAVLRNADAQRRTSFGIMDELFVMDAIPARAIAAIGYEPERMYWQDLETIRRAAGVMDIPLIRMDGWQDDRPDDVHLDSIIQDSVEGHLISSNP